MKPNREAERLTASSLVPLLLKIQSPSLISVSWYPTTAASLSSLPPAPTGPLDLFLQLSSPNSSHYSSPKYLHAFAGNRPTTQSGKQVGNCTSSLPLPFLKIQSSCLISSSVTDHLLHPCLLTWRHLQWMTDCPLQPSFPILTPLSQSLNTAGTYYCLGTQSGKQAA